MKMSPADVFTKTRLMPVWVFWCLDVQVFRCLGVQVFRCSGVQAAGVSHDSSRAQTCTFEVPALQKHHQNFTRRPRETQKELNCAGRGKKTAKFWAPHPSGPHPSRPTLRGPTVRAPPFGAPLFGCLTVRGPTLLKSVFF